MTRRLKHGAEVTLPVPPHIYEQDAEMWFGLATPLGEFLLLERALESEANTPGKGES
jgi:hypothetical protein